MMLDFGMIALVLIVVLWIILIVTANRRDRRHFALEERVDKAERKIRDQHDQISAMESKIAQLEIEVSNFR